MKRTRSRHALIRISRTCLLLCSVCFANTLAAHHAHAQQFVLIDQTYTATAENTADSHYRIAPIAGTPSNWRAPVDYASGKIYVQVDVQSKPSNEPTIYNVCYEKLDDKTTKAACMGTPPSLYQSTGRFDFSQDISSFWSDTGMPWEKGIDEVALILKDKDQKKKQADPKFYPTTIHVTITVVAPGTKYSAPAGSSGAAAGSGGASGQASGQAGTSAGANAGTDAAGASGDSGANASAGHAATGAPGLSGQGGQSGGPGTAGATGGSAAGVAGAIASAGATGNSGSRAPGSAAPIAGTSSGSSSSESGGCSVAQTTSQDLGWLGYALAFTWLRARRKRASKLASR